MACHLWTAAFFSELTQEAYEDLRIPTTHDLVLYRKSPSKVDRRTTAHALALAQAHSFFHWPLEFPEVFERGGFYCVLGNPPWVSHVGRAAHPLSAGHRRWFLATFDSFTKYRTTHGMFVERTADALLEGGAVGIVVPSSLSELDGYYPTRRALDCRCQVREPLHDFGEGVFPGVTMPCMALVARRTAAGRRTCHGGRWQVGAPLLEGCAAELHARLCALPPFPSEAFGERGLQTTPELGQHVRTLPEATGVYDTPLREGADIDEFSLGHPRLYCNASALGPSLRPPAEFIQVDLLIRQTARFPIVARNDGEAFRNSLLAGFGTEGMPWPFILCILNSSLVRWLHYYRFMDARQKAMPQMKVGHLRSIPAPPNRTASLVDALTHLGQRLTARNNGIANADRIGLDAMIAELYNLSRQEAALIGAWWAAQSWRR